MKTVGLDFGTHQTKICIETKEGVECNYSFLKYTDTHGILQYAIPSIIHIDEQGLLSYGYISPKKNGRIIRYFKQSAFCTIAGSPMKKSDAMLYSIWYIAFILFDLEELYGTEFTIQMGVPTDSGHYDAQKRIAVQILAGAYRLVEDVFKGKKSAFLSLNEEQLREKTVIPHYSDTLKNNYGILVFPEAYACLKPLSNRGKIAHGMSLMVDIGGGTTDISFFTIENNLPQVYDFFSINKGLNFLTEAFGNDDKSAANKVSPGKGTKSQKAKADSNVQSAQEIIPEKTTLFKNEVTKRCKQLILQLQAEFCQQTDFPLSSLNKALTNRPIIYSGGGSTFRTLRVPYQGFQDIKLISHHEWAIQSIEDIKDIVNKGLCPILSTAYGLSISVPDDKISQKPFRDIFDKMRYKSAGSLYDHKEEDHDNRKFSLYDDYDTYK